MAENSCTQYKRVQEAVEHTMDKSLQLQILPQAGQNPSHSGNSQITSLFIRLKCYEKAFNSGNTLLCSNLALAGWSFVFPIVSAGSDLGLTCSQASFL